MVGSATSSSSSFAARVGAVRPKGSMAVGSTTATAGGTSSISSKSQPPDLGFFGGNLPKDVDKKEQEKKGAIIGAAAQVDVSAK